MGTKLPLGPSPGTCNIASLDSLALSLQASDNGCMSFVLHERGVAFEKSFALTPASRLAFAGATASADAAVLYSLRAKSG